MNDNFFKFHIVAAKAWPTDYCYKNFRFKLRWLLTTKINAFINSIIKKFKKKNSKGLFLVIGAISTKKRGNVFSCFFLTTSKLTNRDDICLRMETEYINCIFDAFVQIIHIRLGLATSAFNYVSPIIYRSYTARSKHFAQSYAFEVSFIWLRLVRWHPGCTKIFIKINKGCSPTLALLLPV